MDLRCGAFPASAQHIIQRQSAHPSSHCSIPCTAQHAPILTLLNPLHCSTGTHPHTAQCPALLNRHPSSGSRTTTTTIIASCWQQPYFPEAGWQQVRTDNNCGQRYFRSISRRVSEGKNLVRSILQQRPFNETLQHCLMHLCRGTSNLLSRCFMMEILLLKRAMVSGKFHTNKYVYEK